MAVVVRVMDWNKPVPLKQAGHYIRFVDVQMIPNEMWLQLTPDWQQAKSWDSVAEFMTTYREILKSSPVRLDGRPNRPLTGFTVQIEQIIQLEGEQDGEQTNSVE